jgi:hypothetical protein
MKSFRPWFAIPLLHHLETNKGQGNGTDQGLRRQAKWIGVPIAVCYNRIGTVSPGGGARRVIIHIQISAHGQSWEMRT